jgi:hypothetical protein
VQVPFDVGDGGRRRFGGHHEQVGEVVGEPEPVTDRPFVHDDQLAAGDPGEFGQPGRRVPPVMHGKHRHRRIEDPVIERERLGQGLHRRSGTGRALIEHQRRRVNGNDPPVGRLVAARSRAHVYHGAGVTERGVDLGGDPRVFAAGTRIPAADHVIPRPGIHSRLALRPLPGTALPAE